MIQADYGRFVQILSACADMYNAKRPTDMLFSMWWNAMKQYDIETVQRAFSAHVQNPDNGQFMPKPADIIRLIGGTSTDKAQLAWTAVDKAVRHYGVYDDVVFDDPIIHAVITDMGGWVKFGNRTEKEWDFDRNEFIGRYRGYSTAQSVPHVPVLVGIANAQNARCGYKPNPPRLLGDKQRAEQVYLTGKAETSRLPSHAMTLLN